jgi:hypothetical protein
LPGKRDLQADQPLSVAYDLGGEVTGIRVRLLKRRV